MKVKRIELDNYEIEMQTPDGSLVKVPYDVKKSIGDIILAPQLKLNGSALLKNYSIAEKFFKSKESYILLEFSDYSVIRNAIESLEIFGKNEVELIKRILEAKEVEVKEV